MNHASQLKDYLARLADGGLCVAFSGGVDSAVLLKSAREVCENVHAVTLYTPFHSPSEPRLAEKLALDTGVKFKLIRIPELPDEILDNPPERCYLCKRLVFEKICGYAAQNGLKYVLDGTNADDLNEYRPGLRALRELNVKSPLAELGLVKAQVRDIARQYGLEVSGKPSAPCLATRIPYNTRIVPGMLEKIDGLEDCIKAFGVEVVRARVHDGLVRIETMPRDFSAVLEYSAEITERAKALGFSRITLDLEGFRSGSFDQRDAEPTRSAHTR